MQNVNQFLTEQTFMQQIDKQNAALAALLMAKNGSIKPSSWESVQRIVRDGLASKVFAIGDQLICQRNGVNLVWDIIGIDHDTPADPQFTHSMTLQLHDCLPTTMQLDASEAFYYAENGLEAGTYHFTIDSTYDATYNDLTSYQFTLTQAVPAGGQLLFDWTYKTQASAAKVTSYASATSTTAIEQVAVSEGTDGTNLGTLTEAGDFINNLNSITRVRYGSNNYKESGIRQWLNSNAAAGSVWTAQNNFDRPPNWHTGEDGTTKQAGFLNGMDADFLAVIGKTHIVTARNTVTDGGGVNGATPSDRTDDYFFLLSRSEIYGGAEVSGVNEGEPYPYYADYSDLNGAGAGNDSNRIKSRSGMASYWWIRTPYYGDSITIHIVNPTGGVGGSGANNVYYGVAPACNII